MANVKRPVRILFFSPHKIVIIAILVVVVLVGVVVLAMTKPDIITIQRATEIKSPPDRIFTYINDLHNWPAWAPQDKMDITMKRNFSGGAHGKGACSEWTSKGKAGTGRMEITESVAPSKITVVVDFVKPFAAHNVNEFALEPRGDVTRVTWTMRGTNPLILKLMSVFADVDSMMGKHFETGLHSLKVLAES